MPRGYCDECKKNVDLRYEEDPDDGNRSTWVCRECNCEVERLTER